MISFKCFIINQGTQLRHNAPVPPSGRELPAWPGPAADPGRDGTGRERGGIGASGNGSRRAAFPRPARPGAGAVRGAGPRPPAAPLAPARAGPTRAESPFQPNPVLDSVIFARCVFPKGSRFTTAVPPLFSARDLSVRLSESSSFGSWSVFTEACKSWKL